MGDLLTLALTMEVFEHGVGYALWAPVRQTIMTGSKANHLMLASSRETLEGVRDASSLLPGHAPVSGASQGPSLHQCCTAADHAFSRRVGPKAPGHCDCLLVS